MASRGANAERRTRSEIRMLGDMLCALALVAIAVALVLSLWQWASWGFPEDAWSPGREVQATGGSILGSPRSLRVAAGAVYLLASLWLFGLSLAAMVRGLDRTRVRKRWLWVVTMLMHPIWIVPYWLVHGRRELRAAPVDEAPPEGARPEQPAG